jgi:hypothetical protein
MTHVATPQDILAYECQEHGEWHLGPRGLYRPDDPPPQVRELLKEPTSD